jgi:hypothetical protein
MSHTRALAIGLFITAAIFLADAIYRFINL